MSKNLIISAAIVAIIIAVLVFGFYPTAVVALIVCGIYFLVKSLIRYYYALKNGDNVGK